MKKAAHPLFGDARCFAKTLRVMKLSAFLLLIALQVSATNYGQNVSLKLKNASLKQAFRTLERQTNYRFFYSSDEVPIEAKVSVTAKNEELTILLSRLLAPYSLNYTRRGNTIVVGRTPNEAGNLIIKRYEKRVTGVVVGENSEPLPGVSVLIKGTSAGTTTDDQGRYAIDVPDNSAVLIFSFSGRVEQEKLVGNTSVVNITLRLNDQSMDKVVVIGYGTKKKIHLTGSVATVSGKELTEAPVANLSNAIAGRLPGVIATNPNGRPGSGSNLNIRGFSTLDDPNDAINSNGPLIVVDGVVRDGFNAFDPNEIESITVLKDVAATAIYGARANNGVFLVTTKRGALGKPTITYNGNTGIQQPTNYPKIMNGEQFANAWNQALNNQGFSISNPAQTALYYTEDQIAKYRSGEDGEDWYKATFKKNPRITSHNFTVNGGSEAIKYFVSLGTLNQEGMYDNIGYKVYRFRSNVDAKISNALSIGVDIEGRQENSNAPRVDANTIFEHVARQTPTFKAYYASGRAVNNGGDHVGEEIRSSGYNRLLQNTFQGTLSAVQKLDIITKGLSAQARVSFGKQYGFRKEFYLPYTMYNEDANGNVTGTKVVGALPSLRETFVQNYSTFYNLSLNYQRKFGNHDLGALLLYEQNENLGDDFNAFKQDFPITTKDELFVSGPANQTITGRSTINDARKSLVGRLGYIFSDKYLLEGSFRYDGSYIFPKERRFGFFPAVSAGWRISEEAFFKNSPSLGFINNLKLRGSWGMVGNDKVAAFQYQDAYTIGSTSGPFFSGVPQSLAYYGVYPNPFITWEKANNTNIGLEAGFFSNHLSVEFDYFTKDTRDILWARVRSVPATFGRSLPRENYARVRNRGFEMTVNHNGNAGQVKYRLSANGSYAKNKVLVIDDPANALDFQKQLGKPLGIRIGYEAQGLFQSTEEAGAWMGGKQFGVTSLAGDIKYADLNDDGIIDSKDQKILSENSATPRVMYGLSGGANWKNFDLSFLFQGAAARDFLVSRNGRITFDGGAVNAFSYLLDAWSPSNKDAEYPLLWRGSRSINNQTSSVWLTNGNYLRLKSVNLGYTFSPVVLKSININSIRFFVSGLNLATWSKISKKFGFDPEAESGAGNYYPQQRTYSAGLNVNF